MATGNMEHFEPESQKFDEWVERLEFFFNVNDVNETKKVSWLLTLIGSEVYSVLKSLINPEKPSTKTFDELVKILLKHYEPENNVIAERYKFNSRVQQTYESVSEFSVTLRNLASTCNFGTFLDDALRDRFVCGLTNTNMQCTLLQKAELTFETACHTALAIEMTETQMKFLHRGNPTEVNNMNTQITATKIDTPTPKTESNAPKTDRVKAKCFRCGREHNPNYCPAREWTCFKCKEKGHVATLCPTNKDDGDATTVVSESD